jgi:transglutaminase-like putative cysteine protease
MNASEGRAALVDRPDNDALMSAEVVRYRLRQRFSYRYVGQAYDLRHRLVVVPPSVHGDQRLRLGSVEVTSDDAEVVWRSDEDGNRTTSVRLAVVPETVDMLVSVMVERGGPAEPMSSSLLRDTRMLRPTALTQPDERIRSLARENAVADAEETADRICSLIPTLVSYGFGATDVDTPAADALAGGTGVCQDQAHVMLAMCRSVGVRARYVSGHLIGQGGTHAWVEVLVPDGLGARAVAFDPCHGRRADRRYVTIATGRDYRDVAPTSGSYSGDARGELSTSRALSAEIVA